MTREQMVAVLRDGGSVLHGGKILTTEAELPLEEELAQSPEEKAKVENDLRAQVAALNARLASLEDTQGDANHLEDGGEKKQEESARPAATTVKK